MTEICEPLRETLYVGPYFTDAEMEAAYSRSPSARLADPMPADDIRDVLNQAACFLQALAHDPEFNARFSEYLAMEDAHSLLWRLLDGKRPVSGGGPFHIPAHGSDGLGYGQLDQDASEENP